MINKTQVSTNINFTETIGSITYKGNYSHSDKNLTNCNFQAYISDTQIASVTLMGTTNQNLNFYDSITPEQKQQIVTDADTIINEIKADVIA